jgi:hypothetical protein
MDFGWKGNDGREGYRDGWMEGREGERERERGGVVVGKGGWWEDGGTEIDVCPLKKVSAVGPHPTFRAEFTPKKVGRQCPHCAEVTLT